MPLYAYNRAASIRITQPRRAGTPPLVPLSPLGLAWTCPALPDQPNHANHASPPIPVSVLRVVVIRFQSGHSTTGEAFAFPHRCATPAAALNSHFVVLLYPDFLLASSSPIRRRNPRLPVCTFFFLFPPSAVLFPFAANSVSGARSPPPSLPRVPSRGQKCPKKRGSRDSTNNRSSDSARLNKPPTTENRSYFYFSPRPSSVRPASPRLQSSSLPCVLCKRNQK